MRQQRQKDEANIGLAINLLIAVLLGLAMVATTDRDCLRATHNNYHACD